MAVRTEAPGGTGERSPRGARTAVLRLLTAALAGGAVLLLWGGTAGAADAGTPPSPAASSSDAGLLGTLLGEGGALTPVVDLVDATTGSLTGSTPVGSTVSGVATTVDPVVTPAVAPVTDAADPVLAPVVETVGAATTTVVGPITTSLPTTPVVPPTAPPTDVAVVDPEVLLPELPPLLPPDPTTVPGATPGTGPASTAGPAAVGSGALLPLVALDRAPTTGGRSLHAASDGTSSPADRSTASTAAEADRTELRPTLTATSPGDDGTRGTSHRSARSTVPAPAAAPCSAPGSGTPGAAGPAAHLALPTASLRCGATSLETPAGALPHRAPAAEPDVAPD